MLLNLSRAFHFGRDKKKYEVDYLFTKGTGKEATADQIFLVLNISVNEAEKKTHRISKPMATLYQSNEVIEKMIEEETVSLELKQE